VLYDTETGKLIAFAKEPNETVADRVGQATADHLAIEMIGSYGMAVGATVFETCVWIGRFIGQWPGEYTRVFRKGRWGDNKQFPGVAMTLCRSNLAKDSNIRRAILDLYEPTGGGKIPQIGTKSKPGPLCGVSKDVWAALAVAITWNEHMGHNQTGEQQ